jgi:hypothetical protein
MSTDSSTTDRDISVPQRLARLLVEIERLIKLVDDINKHATTPQSKSALTLIDREVSSIVGSMKATIDPLYNLYEIDPGLKSGKCASGTNQAAAGTEKSEYDETALWTDVKKQAP